MRRVVCVSDRLEWVVGERLGEVEEFEFVGEYRPIYQDFGPLNLAELSRFCSGLEGKLAESEAERVQVVCSSKNEEVTNYAVLICIFSVLKHGKSMEEMFKLIEDSDLHTIHFRDASYWPEKFDLSYQDVVSGFLTACSLNLVSLLSAPEATQYNDMCNLNPTDMNWMINNKLLGFSSPISAKYDFGYRAASPEDYLPFFLSHNVKLVIRLTRPFYDNQIFVRNGIKHIDLPYPDGGTPSDSIVRRFFELMSEVQGEDKVAVHCTGGVGRTGTLTALYVMKEYGMKAKQTIGYLRIMRQGSVEGFQQHFLLKKKSYGVDVKREKGGHMLNLMKLKNRGQG